LHNSASLWVQFGAQVAHGHRKKPFDLGGNPSHVTLRQCWESCKSNDLQITI